MSDTIDCPRCKHEHEPTYSHEDDHGKWECDACGFEFDVEIEYESRYDTCCQEHQYGAFEFHTVRSGETVEARFCIHCEACQLREQADGKDDDGQGQAKA